jgi:Papain family cysteine protease
MTRRYGRQKDLHDSRDVMMTYRRQFSLPSATRDLRVFSGPVKDQGNEGSCTAHAGAAITEWINRKYLRKTPVLSPQDIYANELMLDGNFPNDVGSYGRTCCRVLTQYGVCPEALYAYTPGEILAPSAEQTAAAKEFRLGAYHRLTGSAQVISCLADDTPWPVLVGFTVRASFESSRTAQTGVMQLPTANEIVLSGHEVAITGGYDVGPTPTLRPQNCPPAVLVQNSWGTSWGLQGYFWMPLAILDDPDTDLMIVHSGKPWS